jgi:hypothetical protein
LLKQAGWSLISWLLNIYVETITIPDCLGISFKFGAQLEIVDVIN